MVALFFTYLAFYFLAGGSTGTCYRILSAWPEKKRIVVTPVLVVQVQREELLMQSASFGPILGPITTLTSLANFKARSHLTPRVTAESSTRHADSPPRPAACSTTAKQPIAAGAPLTDWCGTCENGDAGRSAEVAQTSGQKGVPQEEQQLSKDQGVPGAVSPIESAATAADRNAAAVESRISSMAKANVLPSGDPPTQLLRPGDSAPPVGLAALLDGPPRTSRAGDAMSAHGSSRAQAGQAGPDGGAPPSGGHAMPSGGGSGGLQQLPARKTVSAGDIKSGLPCNGVREAEPVHPVRLQQVDFAA